MIDVKSNSEFFFTTSSIPLNFGGLTTALFRRAHVLSEKFDKKINILTFKYKYELDEIKQSLNEKKYTNNKVIFKNMYDYLSEYSSTVIDTNPKIKSILDESDVLQKSELYDRSITKKGNNVFEEYKKDDIVEQINEIDNKGNIKRIRTFEKGELYKEYYFRKDGLKYMIKSFKENKKVNEILLLNKNEEVLRKFSNHKHLQLFWLELLTYKGKKNYFINDNRDMDNLIISYDKTNIIRIFVIHSIHLRPPYNAFSTLRSGNEYLFNHIGLADGIVLLTNKQMEDIILRYGESPVYHVIPHYIGSNKNEILDKKIHNRFIVVSRFHEEKQIDHIIKAFSLVERENIDFQLDIYGTGKEKESLKGMIDDLSLQGKIKLHDFTNNPELEFSKSIGSFITSKYEGFGLTILESLKNNCPVFAYDIKYGPSDMLQNGFNGYLIESNNIEALASAIMHFINLPNNKKEMMFTNSSKSIASFNKEVFEERWEKVLENAFYYSKYRHEVLQKENIRNEMKNIFLKEE